MRRPVGTVDGSESDSDRSCGSTVTALDSERSKDHRINHLVTLYQSWNQLFLFQLAPEQLSDTLDVEVKKKNMENETGEPPDRKFLLIW